MKTYVHIYVVIILLFLTGPVFCAQNPTENINIILWNEYQIPDAGEVLIDVTVTVPQGNHIYIEHLETDSKSILAEFRIPEGAGIRLAKTINPVGEVLEKDLIMKGTRIFYLVLENTQKREDMEKAVIPIELTVQMCNDDSGLCYIPYTFKEELKVIFLKKTKTKSTTSKDGIHWVFKHADGVEEARQLNRKLFVLITAPEWCGPCQYLEETTLRDSKVIEFINSNFIPVQIRDTVNGKRNPELWTYAFEGYPSYLVATPDKEILYQDAGTIPASSLLAELKEFEIKEKDDKGRILSRDIIRKVTCAVRFTKDLGLVILNNGEFAIFNLADRRMDNQYPLSIARGWKDILPYQNSIISGLNYLNGKYYLFLSDKRYLRFSEGSLSLDPGYPGKIDSKTWPGLDRFSSKITGSVLWGKNNKAYFFLDSGDYLRYDKKTSKIDPGYPKEINNTTWSGLDPWKWNIAAAYNDGQGFTFFLLTTGEIVTYDEEADKVMSEPTGEEDPAESPGDSSSEDPVEEVIGGNVINADDSTFYPLTKKRLAFVDFYADWCGPCKEFAPVFKKTAEKLIKGLFLKVDVDQSPGLCTDFNIEWIPYVVAVYDGKLLEQAPRGEEAFLQWAADLIKKYE